MPYIRDTRTHMHAHHHTKDPKIFAVASGRKETTVWCAYGLYLEPSELASGKGYDDGRTFAVLERLIRQRNFMNHAAFRLWWRNVPKA